ncbi:tyrosine-type recombinase/integrase [Sphingomonas sp. Tas61C01]|uniref:tyrosine-type recombinase/integrase n=1 Tax=Sphingomonas sp. Tas61C01 TaxID=3458297 RepID=UPI00403ED14B
MPCRRAKILTEEQFLLVEAYVAQRSRQPESDALKLLLSFRAGLRACEIARLQVSDMTDASGRAAKYISIPGRIAKRNKARQVPMHPEIRVALFCFQATYPRARFVAITSRTQKGRKSMTANALAQWFHHLFKEVGFKGASSHSGRRTFATNINALLKDVNGSINDLQRLMGHARLETTALYIDPLPNLGALVNAI